MSGPLRVYLIAGEPSGDQLGAYLIDGLRALRPELELHGIGGPLMSERGLQSLFAMSDLSVMGLTEVLPRLPHLLRRVRETAEDVLSVVPDVLITIDSPDFCLRVTKKVRAARTGLPMAHYVAPSVWAWRPKRARKMARTIDHVLALLPFEPPYMTAAGMSCDFVGHPVARMPAMGEEAAADFRADHGIALDAPVLCVLPGSRRGEVARHGPVYAETIRRLAGDIDGLRVVIPATGPVVGDVREIFSGLSSEPVVLDPAGLTPEAAARRKWAAFAAADAAVATSGTVSLELARQGTPMVIGYKMSAISQMIVRRMFRAPSATLVNLAIGRNVVPEFFFEHCTADNLAPEVARLFSDDQAVADQRAAASEALSALGADGEEPGLRAARSVLEFLERREAAGV